MNDVERDHETRLLAAVRCPQCNKTTAYLDPGAVARFRCHRCYATVLVIAPPDAPLKSVAALKAESAQHRVALRRSQMV